MSEFSQEPIETGEAIEKLRAFEDDNLNPQVVDFAHFLADRISPLDTMIPEDLALYSIYALYDLEQGVDDATHEPLSGPLVGLSREDYDELLRQVPFLARIAFPENFANRVLQAMISYDLLPPPEAAITNTLDEGEIITDPIHDIDQATIQIIDDAKKRLLGLNWANFGVSEEMVIEAFNVSYLLTLRNAPYILPLNVLVDDDSHEGPRLLELPEQQKKQIAGEYWLAILTSEIPPDYAMATRDHVFLKTMESVIALNELDAQSVLNFLRQDVDGPVGRATIRLHTFITAHPELNKE